MKKKQFIALITSVAFVAVFLPPAPAKAQSGLLPFGGVVSFRTECTCSSGMTYIWFSPLYLGGPLILTGPLVYSSISTVLYPDFEIGVSGTWHLGDYIPAVQACWMTAGNSCVVLPSIGLMGKVATNKSTGS